jgi:uncharacterized protein YuzE
MKLEYDREADAVYIQITKKPFGFMKTLDNNRRIDYDAGGKPTGIELLAVSHGVDLRDLPFRAKIERLLKDNDNIKIYA